MGNCEKNHGNYGSMMEKSPWKSMCLMMVWWKLSYKVPSRKCRFHSLSQKKVGPVITTARKSKIRSVAGKSLAFAKAKRICFVYPVRSHCHPPLPGFSYWPYWDHPIKITTGTSSLTIKKWCLTLPKFIHTQNMDGFIWWTPISCALHHGHHGQCQKPIWKWLVSRDSQCLKGSNPRNPLRIQSPSAFILNSHEQCSKPDMSFCLILIG